MKGAGSALTDVLNPHRAECGKLRAECGKLRAEFGEWRVELKALVCLPCKGRGTAERWRGFDLECGKRRVKNDVHF